MIVRAYQPADADALAQIYFDAVRIGAAPKYTSQQLAAWAPARPSAEAWAARLTGLVTWVATDPQPIGFMSLRLDGYLDLAFVAPDVRGRGVADALYAALLSQTQNLPRLTTEASLMAEPFFRRHGWSVSERQTITRHGVTLENVKMILPLGE